MRDFKCKIKNEKLRMCRREQSWRLFVCLVGCVLNFLTEITENTEISFAAILRKIAGARKLAFRL